MFFWVCELSFCFRTFLYEALSKKIIDDCYVTDNLMTEEASIKRTLLFVVWFKFFPNFSVLVMKWSRNGTKSAVVVIFDFFFVQKVFHFQSFFFHWTAVNHFKYLNFVRGGGVSRRRFLKEKQFDQKLSFFIDHMVVVFDFTNELSMFPGRTEKD